MLMFTLMQRMSIEHLTPLLLLFSKVQTLSVDGSLGLVHIRRKRLYLEMGMKTIFQLK